MIALALETTTDRLCVAARGIGRSGGQAAATVGTVGMVRSVGSDSPTVERVLPGVRQHAAGLFPLIAEVLRELGGTLDDVGSLAVADGPGSFTGLRVGFAAAKALARTRPALELWSASTLLVRAAGVAAPTGARVLVVTAALRGELYAASYRLELPRAVETLFSPVLATAESLHRERPDLVVADAPDKLVDRLADQLAAPVVRGPASLPSATALLELAGVEGGAMRVRQADLAEWEPHYGRPAEAQARWEALHGRALPDSSRVTR